MQQSLRKVDIAVQVQGLKPHGESHRQKSKHDFFNTIKADSVEKLDFDEGSRAPLLVAQRS